jgi:hypothetical protein
VPLHIFKAAIHRNDKIRGVYIGRRAVILAGPE